MITLNAEQQAAIDLATQQDPPFVACITGAPGTGKTTNLRELLRVAGAKGLRTAQAAPSGKAAQRMEEATGAPSQTLHRLLRLQPGSEDWSPIHVDLLVIDEASMVDVPLMRCALAAARAGFVRTVLLVGDADQLPPVGPGQPFHDLLASGRVPAVRLTQIHRQAAGSGIVRAAHALVSGHDPVLAPDFEFVEVEDLAQIPAACWGVVRGEGLDPTTSQILVPQRPTAGGGNEINRFIEESRRPVVEGEPLVRGLFRAGTKVINTKNDYTLEVYNGELGEVVEAIEGRDERTGKPKPNRDELLVEIAGGRKRYAGGAIRALQPAWALTVHKSQGSQWDDVIFVAHRSHTHMLTRRLAYTAITRAAKRVWIVGTTEALGKAARNTKDARRDTWLGRRFARDAARAEMEQMEAEVA